VQAEAYASAAHGQEDDQELDVQLREFDQLVRPLQQELAVYPQLQAMVHGVLDNQVHPYAIDGGRLAALQGSDTNSGPTSM
jgi:hypothetical protein